LKKASKKRRYSTEAADAVFFYTSVTKASCCLSEHKQFRGFLVLDIFGRFFTLDFCLILSHLHGIFCEDILSYLNITNLPILTPLVENMKALRPKL
jgi:hypothetical protein